MSELQPLVSNAAETPSTDAAPSGQAPIIGILKEQSASESRVTIPPEQAGRFVKLGYTVFVELGAGKKCGYDDPQYVEQGCVILPRAQVEKKSLIMFCIEPPVQDFPSMKGKYLFAWVNRRADSSKDMIQKAQGLNMTLMDVTAIPRISPRKGYEYHFCIAQKFDLLSSQAAVAGHRAVVEATYSFGRFHEAAMTAAGKYPPSQTFVLGCGVAGLAAIGAARAMGSIVQAWDVRAVCEEQVQSLGAKWVTVDFKEDGAGVGGYAKESSAAFQEAQKNTFRKICQKIDIIITTAAIPGRPSPELITADMVQMMRPGSVIVDLASVGGGNCALTKKGSKFTTPNGVTIIGYENFPSLMPQQASLMYGTNLYNLMGHITGKAGPMNFFPAIAAAVNAGDAGDLTIRNIVCCTNGVPNAFPPQPEPSPPKPKTAAAVAVPEKGLKDANPLCTAFIAAFALTIFTMLLVILGLKIPHVIFVSFILAGVAGYQVVWGVSPALHTPLISVTNAISGLTTVGGLLLLKNTNSNLTVKVVSAIAIVVSAINVVGGFIVTKRMLLLFQRPGERDYSYLLFIPGAGLIVLSLINKSMEEPVSVMAALLCIASIGGSKKGT